MANKKEPDMETKIHQHKRDKKKLIPPMMTMPKMSPSAWIHDRLPEILWGVLIVGNLKRETALEFFRYIGAYVQENEQFADITHSALGELPDKDLRKFVQRMIKFSDEIQPILRILCKYPQIPGYKIWNEYLSEGLEDKDANKLSQAVAKNYNHQSQEATDCRWLKILCMVLGGKFKLQTKEQVKEILEYPNYGDQTRVRPTIRASEMILQPKDFDWIKYFWKRSYEITDCVPEELYSKKIENLREDLQKQIETKRSHYMGETKKVRDELVEHFFQVVEGSELDIRRETSFGLALYAQVLFTEIIFYNGTHSLTGRIALRSLIEVFISFEYLLKEEVDEPNIWNDFYEYGKGQAKLIHLKLKELKTNASSIDAGELDALLNEDKWLEYIPINLGQWGKTDLRKMSEEANVKDIYDKYYSYTSGYVHGTGLAIRESIYQRCLNPLHRFHRIPIFDLTLRPSVLDDAVEILNKIINCLDKAYPKLKKRINTFKEKKK